MSSITHSTHNLVARAQLFAADSHASIGHTRKYTGEPYIVHPAAVAAIVRGVRHTPEMLAAAWLHDTVEDTPVELADIDAAFGAEVAELVEMLTDISRPGDGNRAARKAIDRRHTAQASPAAKTVKLADLIDNLNSITRRDPSFARVVFAEKRQLLDVLRDGDPILWHRADAITTRFESRQARAAD